jgi:hypothetical protein
MVHCFELYWGYLNDTLLLMINREVHRVHGNDETTRGTFVVT